MIAVKNLYYLLLYAWDAFTPGRMTAIDAEPETDLLNLLASVLRQGIDHLLRRGLDRGYVAYNEPIVGVRGKLEISASVKSNLLHHGRTVCQFDELSHNVAHNRILKTTLGRLLRTGQLDRVLRDSVRATYLRLADIEEVRLTRRLFQAVQLHGNTRFYRFLLDVCVLVHDCLVPDETAGKFRFRDFVRDERRMHRLFERFLYNFYRHEQTAFRVSRPTMAWSSTTGNTPEAQELLPTLKPDICLTRPKRTIIMDAKYYPQTLQRHPAGGLTLHSSHLYQVFAYLKNLSEPADVTGVEAILLYARGDRDLDLSYMFHGHRLRIYTIDLGQHWKLIRRNLLDLVLGSDRSSM